MIELGYACINETLSNKKISVNNSMIKKTFVAKGLDYCAILIEKNLDSLEQIVDWNESNNIKLYRTSSDMFPWMSEYEISELPNYGFIKKKLKQIGDKVKEYGHTLETHPGQYVVLASATQKVIDNSIKELNQHAEIFDLMGMPLNHFANINIHLGSTRAGDKQLAMDTWIDSYHRLNDSVKKRITLENDDKQAMFTIQDLMYVHEKIGIPLVFDSLHYTCHNDGYGYEETFDLAYSTWDKDIVPLCHHSSSKKLWEDKTQNNERAHSEYLYEPFNNVDKPARVMLECKKKEIALLDYRKKF